MNPGDFQVAVIGGGVVGCAVLRAFALAGARAVLLERGPDILSGASKGNSALFHTGYDSPTGSLELDCVREGYDAYLDIRERLNLPLIETSASPTKWICVAQQIQDFLDSYGATDREAVIHLIPVIAAREALWCATQIHFVGLAGNLESYTKACWDQIEALP